MFLVFLVEMAASLVRESVSNTNNNNNNNTTLPRRQEVVACALTFHNLQFALASIGFLIMKSQQRAKFIPKQEKNIRIKALKATLGEICINA